MRKIIKVLTNGRVLSAIVSALGAIISAVCAGCKLYLGELSVKDFKAEIYSAYSNTTNANSIIKQEVK